MVVEEIFALKFTRHPAHGYDRGAVANGYVHTVQQVAEAVRGSLDQKNHGLRCDRVGPLDIERDFDRPVRVRSRLASVRVDLSETAVGSRTGWQTILFVENTEVGLDIRVVIGVNDSDHLSMPLIVHSVKAIGTADLRRG